MNELYIRGIIVLLVIFLVPLIYYLKKENEKTSYTFMLSFICL